jgi:predicted nucleic acid-binding protein
MGLIEEIGSNPVFLDTCIFIYFIEENKAFISTVNSIFAGIDKGKIYAVTSELTLLETLVIPLRANDEKLAQTYEEILSESQGLVMKALDRNLLINAADLRTKYGIKTPDAIQISAALQTNCKTMITNDRRFPRIPGIKILQLNEYLKV